MKEREGGTRRGMGQIWNVTDKLRTLLSGQIFCITAVAGGGGASGVCSRGGSFLVRIAPAELFFFTGTANGII